jgi:hypothetical protein
MIFGGANHIVRQCIHSTKDRLSHFDQATGFGLQHTVLQDGLNLTDSLAVDLAILVLPNQDSHFPILRF